MILLISSLICYLGIFCGVAVGKIAEEELKDGKRYFVWIEDIILGGIVFFILAFVSRNILISIVTGVIGIVILRMAKINLITKTVVVYISLAGVHLFGYSTFLKHPDLFTYPALVTLIFLYGFPAGSILLQKKISLVKIGLYAFPYLVISIIGLMII